MLLITTRKARRCFWLDNNTGEKMIQADAEEKDPFRFGVEKVLEKAAGKKKRNIVLYWSLKRLGQQKKAQRVRSCGTWMSFGKSASGGARLLNMNLCRYKLCPVCQWRREVRVARDLSMAMEEAEKLLKGATPLFLTLTMKSCEGKDLKGALDAIFQGWNRVNNNDRIKRIAKGWFRSLEITYNREDKAYHPHLHVVLLVGREYFGRDYMATEEWAGLWKKAMRLDYSPICDIRRIYGDRRKSVAEVAKYVAKDSHYLYPDKSLTDEVVSTLDSALFRRRLVAYGGVLKQAKAAVDSRAKERKKIQGEEELEALIRGDVAEAVEEYGLRFSLQEYALLPKRAKARAAGEEANDSS